VTSRLFLIFVTATDPIMDRLARLRPYFGQLAAKQMRGWLVARPLARLLSMQLGRPLAAVLLIGVSSYRLPAALRF
jgi:hypothetical protein